VLSDGAKKLSTEVHHFAIQNQLINLENEGLCATLDTQKKYKKQKKALDVQQRKEYWGGATFYSPQKIRKTQFCDTIKAHDKDTEELRKQTAKELRKSNSLLSKKLNKQRAEKAAKAKVDCKRFKAGKAAQAETKKAAQNTKKTLQTAQSGKREASRASSPKGKRQKQSGGVAACLSSPEAAPAAEPKVNSRGRAINLPSKYT
jgi:hypothetical protein